MRGVYTEIQKLFGKSVQNYIIASRTAQGYEEWKDSTREQREAVVARWYFLLNESEKGRHGSHFAELESASKGLVDSLRKSNNEKQQHRGASTPSSSTTEKESVAGLGEALRTARNTLSHSLNRPHLQRPSPDEYEDLVQCSVEASSTGNAEEDRMIENALRASIAELHAAEAEGLDDQEACNRALRAGAVESQRSGKERSLSDPQTEQSNRAPPPLPPRYSDIIADDELDRVLEESSKSHVAEQERNQAELDALTEFAIWKSLKDDGSLDKTHGGTGS